MGAAAPAEEAAHCSGRLGAEAPASLLFFQIEGSDSLPTIWYFPVAPTSPMPPGTFTSNDDLLTPRRFAAAIERIAQRRLASPSLLTLHEGGVSFTTINQKRHAVARLLVKDLLADRLDATPGRVYHVEKDGKERRLFDFSALEWIIHDVVADWLAEKTSKELSPHLYSYQSGLSYRCALRDFAHYVRTTPARASDHGLYVLRRDVRAYFDSIPVGDGAPLWAILARQIGPASTAGATWVLIRRALCPPLLDSRGGIYRLALGIPTGSPVANVVANLYLSEMDDEVSRVDGAFYARYGDDVVAAHPDAGTAARLGGMLADHLKSKGLEFNPEKTRDFYLTVPGRPVPANIDAQPAAAVEFLGHRICARGTVSLSLRKTRALLEELRTRARRAARSGIPEPEMRIARSVRALNRLLDPRSAAAHPYADLLRTTVTDRVYLRWLDHELALTVLEAGLGRRSVRHFRRFPPKTLRNRFGLRSLVVARNRVGRRR